MRPGVEPRRRVATLEDVPALIPQHPVEERALTRATLPAAMLPEPLGDAPGVSARSALRIADVSACVRLLAGVASSLPLPTYRRTAERPRSPRRGINMAST